MQLQLSFVDTFDDLRNLDMNIDDWVDEHGSDVFLVFIEVILDCAEVRLSIALSSFFINSFLKLRNDNKISWECLIKVLLTSA